MPVKRSRVARSSVFSDAAVVSHLSQAAMDSPELRWDFCAANGFKQRCRSLITDVDPSKPRILTLSSPDLVQGCGEDRIGNFLEKCYYCKNTIREDDEVFMYSYLRAFCTTECRDIQIAMDKAAKKLSGKSTKFIPGQSMLTNVKNQFAIGWESIKPKFHI